MLLSKSQRRKQAKARRKAKIAAAKQNRVAFVNLAEKIGYSAAQKALGISVRRPPVAAPEFLQSYEWRKVRMMALKKYGAVCQCCGASPKTGAVMNVDHIKPRLLFPQLALDVDNLQVLCHECNHGKGNWDMTDWRPDEEEIPGEQMDHLRAIWRAK